jgi:PBS lyase HEAT-like repeat
MSRLVARLILAGAIAFGLSGCAGTYDLVTSQRFKERPFHTLFTREDPIEVLEKVQEGDDRVRAMRAVEEPRQNGGSAAEQDRLIATLQASATTDPRPLCRLAAVEALSRFKDPRVGAILITAYQNAPYDSPAAAATTDGVTPAASLSATKTGGSQFTPDTVTTLQCQTLESLGRHRSPEGLQLLVRVATTPAEPKPKSTGGVEAASALLSLNASISTGESDRIDVRLAAIRALGNYQNDTTAIQALVGVLQTEKDVAVRGRAHESLVKSTGKDLPPDGQAWAAWLAQGGKK